MKKTLAIVLALVMVLAMIPAMSAHTTEFKTITDKSYDLTVVSVNDNGKEAGSYMATASKTNTIEFKYVWSDLKADTTGRYTDDVVMGVVKIEGWDADFTGATTKSVTVDGKVLVEDVADGKIIFPVELTKAGYTDTFVVTVVAEKGNLQISETAKVSIKLVNTETYKAEKTAIITNIVSTDRDIMSAYIVGDKIYLDYVKKAQAGEVKITFADDAGKAFTGKVWAKDIAGKQIWLSNYADVVLDKSAALYEVSGIADTKIKFVIDAANADYITKNYAIVVRENIVEADPKGIYFAEPTKTIAMGETYTPVVMGVATGKPVDASLNLDGVDKEVLDLVDYNTIIGTREGVAYITAEYKTAGGLKKYEASSMKITVTLPGESIPEVEPSATVYYVTCRALNVRAGAGTSYKKVDLIHRGDAVKVVELKNGWAKLADGTYVCAKYIAK